MFGRVRALIEHGHQTMDSAEFTLRMARALLDDIADGVAVNLHVADDAATKLAALMIGRGGDVPLTISIDTEWDRSPHETSQFRGGPYNGKVYRIPPADIADGDITLAGGHRYRWDGKVFAYQGPTG